MTDKLNYQVGQLEDKVGELNKELDDLTQQVNVTEKSLLTLKGEVTIVEQSVDSIKNSITWLFKITSAGLVTVIIAWIVAGGLSVNSL